MSVCEVYWIRRAIHSDVMTEGYVGITTCGFSKRMREHKRHAKRGVTHPLYSAMRKHEDFVSSVILKGSLEYCLFIENKLRPEFNIGYNLKPGGQQSMLGYKHTPESRQKITEANKRRGPVKEHTKELLSIASKGRTHTEETRKRMSDLAKLRPTNPDTMHALQSARKRLIFPWQQGFVCMDVWANAERIFDNMSTYPDYGIHRLSKIVGFTPSQLQVVHRNIKNGWNPYTCQEWQTTFKTNKDTLVSKEGE